MKKLLLLLLVVGLSTFSAYVYADDDFVITREKAAVGDRLQDLVSTGVLGPSGNGQAAEVVEATTTIPINIHRIIVTAYDATASFGIYDTGTTGGTTAAKCKFEIYEATSGANIVIDFGDDPIILTSGFSILATNAYAVIHYRHD